MRLPEGVRGSLALAALASLLAAGPVLGQAADPAPAAVILAPGSTLWLEGTSNVHDYESRTATLTLKLLRAPDAADPADVAALDAWLRSGGLRGLELGVPLATMRSGKDGLDKNMLKALRAKENPEITFLLTNARIGNASGDTLRVSADGTLRVAGSERPITVAGHLLRSEAGVWLEGTHALRMSEFDVKPPTMMMGTMRVHDPVTVHFKLLLSPGAPSGGSNAGARHKERTAP